MATRLNKRFILILTAVILVLGFGVGVVAYVAISGDADRQVRLGKELESKGEYRNAIDRYARAIGKEPMNLKHYDLFEGALLKIVPETSVEAQNRYNQHLALLEKRKGASVDNPESWLRVVEELRRRAILISGGGADVWGPVQEQAERMAEQFDEDGDAAMVKANRQARAIRLHAMAMRLDLLKPQEETEFNEESEMFLEEGSVDVLVWEALLRRRLRRAERYHGKGDTRLRMRELEGDDGFDTLVELMREQGVEQTPELLALQVERYRLDADDLETSEEYQALYDEFQQLTLRLIERIQDLESTRIDGIDSDLLRRAILANILKSSDVMAAVNPLLDQDLLEIDLCLLLFQNLVQYEPVLAQRAAERVLAIDPLPVGLLSMMQASARGEAALAVFDSLYFQRARDNEAVSIEDLKVAREEALLEYAGDPSLREVTLYLDGSIDLAEGDALSARSNFSEVSTMPLVRSIVMQRRFIPRFVTASVLAGERGVAIDELRAYADSLPPVVVTGIRTSIAGELLAIGRLEEAMDQVQRVLTIDGNDEEALALKTEILSRFSRLEAAPAGSDTPESRMYARARAALGDGRPEDARAVLLSAVDRFSDPVFKRMLISVDTILGNKDEARRLAATMENPDEDPLLQRQLVLLDVEDPLERIHALADLSFEDDPSRNAVKYIYLQTLAYSDKPGNEAAKAELPAMFDRAMAELSANRGLRQRVIMGSIEDDRFNGTLDSPNNSMSRAIAALELVETDEVHVLNTKARIAASIGRPASAIEILAPLNERGIDTAHTWYTRGMSYRDLGRMEESMESFANAVDRAPDNWRFVLAYANVLEENGEQDKALELLRASRRSETMALQIRDAWLDAESFYGNRRTALDQRSLIYFADLDDSEAERRVIDTNNALELARLLLIVQPDREDLKRPSGEAKYSVTAWAKFSGSDRRAALAAARTNRRDYAFEIIDEVESVSRQDTERAYVKLVRAQAFSLLDDKASLRQELADVKSCCNDVLSAEQRLRFANLLESVGDEEGVNDQYARLVQSDDLAVLRSIVAELGRRNRLEQAYEVATRVAAESGLVSDQFIVAQSMISLGGLDEAQVLINELNVNEEVLADRDLRYQLLLLDSNFLGTIGQATIERSLALGQQRVQLAAAGDEAGSQAASAESDAVRAQAQAYFERGVQTASEAMELAPGRLVPVLRMHELLRARILMLEDASYEADMLANARLARDIAPTDWRATKCVMEAYLVMGNPHEAMSAVDQYFRLGGLSPAARNALLGIARLEGKPGLAIPPLQRAMELDPVDPEWPRAIAQMLMENDDPQGASDMWWRVLELDSSPLAIDQFVELEFRRTKPNMERIREAFAMKPDVVEGKPELKAAMAATVAADGEARRAGILFDGAYADAVEAIDKGADPIVIDRVLSYYFRVFQNEDLVAAEKRLRTIRGTDLGAHDYGALADQAMRGDSDERDLESAIKYLRRAADLAEGESYYQRALLHRLATILYVTKDCDGAVRVLERVVSMGQSTASTLNNLAYMMLECRNDPDGAVYFSAQAIQANPASPHFLDTHGFILFKLGRNEEAEVFLTRAVGIKPSVSNLLHLATLMHETGRDDEAEILLEKLGKEFPRLAPEQQTEVNELIASIS